MLEKSRKSGVNVKKVEEILWKCLKKLRKSGVNVSHFVSI